MEMGETFKTERKISNESSNTGVGNNVQITKFFSTKEFSALENIIQLFKGTFADLSFSTL